MKRYTALILAYAAEENLEFSANKGENDLWEGWIHFRKTTDKSLVQVINSNPIFLQEKDAVEHMKGLVKGLREKVLQLLQQATLDEKARAYEFLK